MLTSLFHCSPSCPPRSSSSCSLLPEVCLPLLLFLSANQLQRAITSKHTEDRAHRCTVRLLLCAARALNLIPRCCFVLGESIRHVRVICAEVI